MYFSRIKLRPEIFKSSQLNRVLEGNAYGIHRLLWDLFSEQTRNYIYREEIAREQLGSSSNVRGESIYYMVSYSKPIEPEYSLFKVEAKEYHPQITIGQILSFDCRVNPVITKKGKKHDLVMDTQLGVLTGLIKELNLESNLSTNIKKQDYKKQLLAKGGEPLKQLLLEILAANVRYAEHLQQEATLADLLEWALKEQINGALEHWWKRQGERCGFSMVLDDFGFSKLQNSAYQWHALPEKNKQAGFSSVDFVGELQITDVDKFQDTLFNGLGRSKAFGCGLLMVRRV